jgi:flagellar assembly protein FliH
MGIVLKKEQADKIVFNVQPKDIRIEPTHQAKQFVKKQLEKSSDFTIAEVVSNQSGIKDLQRKNLEVQIEDMVLDRMKSIQEQAYKKAYDLGLEEGRKLALDETKAHIEMRLNLFDKFLSHIDGLTKKVCDESEATLAKLMFLIAEKIAMRAIDMDQQPMIQMMKNLAAELQSANQLQILLNPKDADFIESMRGITGVQLDVLERVKIEKSENVKAGGCIITTDFGEIDATVEQRVSQAWSAIAAKLPSMKKDDTI